MSKHYKKLYKLFSILSVILLIVPCGYFVIKALCGPGLVVQKTTVLLSVFLSLALTGIFIIKKKNFRSGMWIVLIGLKIAMVDLMGPIIIFAVSQMSYELIVAPLRDYYRLKYHINKEIDKRYE